MSQVQKAFATYKRHLTGLTAGVTASTYGTAVSDTLPTWAKAVLGVAVIHVLPTVTAAEGKSLKVRFNAKSIGINNAEFETGNVTTSAPATNESGYANIVDFIPLDWKCSGGESVSVDAAPLGASTAGDLVELSWLVTNDPSGLPKKFYEALVNGKCMPFRSGSVVDAQQLTTVRTALTAIKIDSWAEAVVGVRLDVVKTGAITAAEEGIGVLDIDNPFVTDFTIPACFASSATLGTPVGTGIYGNRVPYLPCYIPLSGKEETFTPYIILRTAITTDNRVSAALAWR